MEPLLSLLQLLSPETIAILSAALAALTLVAKVIGFASLFLVPFKAWVLTKLPDGRLKDRLTTLGVFLDALAANSQKIKDSQEIAKFKQAVDQLQTRNLDLAQSNAKLRGAVIEKMLVAPDNDNGKPIGGSRGELR